jgi:hypothetical protein
MTREWGSARRLPFLPAASRKEAMEAAMPMLMVITSDRISCITS